MISNKPFAWGTFVFICLFHVFFSEFSGAQTIRSSFEEHEPYESYDGFSFLKQGYDIYWRGPARTLDRGENWELLTIEHKEGAQNYDDIDISSVIFANNETGFFYGEDDDGLWKTDDAGATWTRIFSGKCYNVWTDNKRRVIVQLGDKGEFLYSSYNSGKSWKSADAPQIQGKKSIINDIVFLDNKTAIASYVIKLPLKKTNIIGVAVSNDNGLTWKSLYKKKVKTDEIWRKLVFFDNLHGWALPHKTGPWDYFYYTADGGKNWQKRKAPRGYGFDEVIPLTKKEALIMSNDAFSKSERFIFLSDRENQILKALDCKQVENIFTEYKDIIDKNPSAFMVREAYKAKRLLGYSEDYAVEPCVSK